MGSLLYLIKHSKPDIENSVRELTKEMDRSDKETYRIILRIIKYVKKPKNKGIEIKTSYITNC